MHRSGRAIVIGMRVGDEDSGNRGRIDSQASQPIFDGARADAGIDQHAGAVGPYQDGVS